jgi:DNA-binding SARP family transcriptional activator
MRRLELSFFGRFQAVVDGEPLAGFRTAKSQALLIYLAAAPHIPHRRETLMTLLWPGMPESAARHNLRQIIYNLRRAFPDLSPDGGRVVSGELKAPVLLANRQTTQLNPTADISSDAARFAALLKGIETHAHLDILLCPDCYKDLAEAADLYRGDFLADFYLNDCSAYENWAEAERQKYRRQALDALETLTTIATQGASYAEARAYAERQLEIDNLRESAYRQLMKILAFNDQRVEALSLYETLKQLLAEELSVAPSARTTERCEQIRAGHLNFSTPDADRVRSMEVDHNTSLV